MWTKINEDVSFEEYDEKMKMASSTIHDDRR